MKLLERQAAGLRVSVDYDRDTADLWLICRCEDRMALVKLPPDRVLDAFAHPACYLPLDHVLTPIAS